MSVRTTSFFIFVAFLLSPALTVRSERQTIISFTSASSVSAQTGPVYDSYKGVKIGMPAAEVRAKLGKPKEESDAEDLYEISPLETARVFYEPDKTVRVVSIMYSGDMNLAPTPKTVVGTDVPAKEDGGIYKMMQYPKAGFWISYVKTGGEGPIVIVTMQKMAKE
ncbi:MAG: hypothetical protein JNK51_03255 [Blastocatellia bacterium]|nr:hypothetical protein [Chloracidobacterium sp.]MBL8183919.1 hypothetical protein [Blastocatellia bacterium]HRJ90323.1 hypothetical protein [Pyrinomonadaceae bacterium]HRK49521.1 hypothetical protein [Pyrinomonadaceae bacterium]